MADDKTKTKGKGKAKLSAAEKKAADKQAELEKKIADLESKLKAKQDESKPKSYQERVDERVNALMNKIPADSYKKAAMEQMSDEDKKNDKLVAARAETIRMTARAEAIANAARTVTEEDMKSRTKTEFERAKDTAIADGLPKELVERVGNESELEMAQAAYKAAGGGKSESKDDKGETKVDDMDTDVGNSVEDDDDEDSVEQHFEGASEDTKNFAKLGTLDPNTKEYKELMNELQG